MSRRIDRYLISALAALLMVGISQLLHEPEILFPEAIALTIGAWILPSQPWKVSKPMLVLLMTTCAVFGVCVVRYLPMHLFLQVGLGFLFVAMLLLLTRTTLFPAMSACILPMFLGTTTWVYPLSVLIIACVLVLTRSACERLGIWAPIKKQHCDPVNKHDIAHWCALFLLFMALAAIPIFSENVYFIAPPLLVSFIEFSDPASPLRQSTKKILLCIVLCSCIGAIGLLFFVSFLGWSQFFAALFILFCLIPLLHKMDTFFPPLGAIAFLPLLLSLENLWLYPFEVSFGGGVLIVLALFVFPTQSVDDVATEAVNEQETFQSTSFMPTLNDPSEESLE